MCAQYASHHPGKDDGRSPIRLSCGNDAFAALPHELAVELVARLGFDGYDLMLVGNRPPLAPEAIRTDASLHAGMLEERVRSRGLDFADLFLVPWTDPAVMAVNHPQESERERNHEQFRGALDLAALLGISGITTVPGLHWRHEPHECSLARAAAELEQRATEAAARGIRLSVEAHVGSVCRNPADVLALCEMAPSLCVTLDYTHFVAAGIDERDVDALLPYARHVHARGAAPGRLQAPVTDNTIDYGRVVEGLHALDYAGYIAVEYVWIEWAHLRAGNEVDVLSQTVRMRDLLSAELASLRSPNCAPKKEGPA